MQWQFAFSLLGQLRAMCRTRVLFPPPASEQRKSTVAAACHSGNPAKKPTTSFMLVIAAILVSTFSVHGISLAAAPAIPATVGWYQIPNSKLRAVCPPNNFGGSGYAFSDFCPGMVYAWNSAVMDTKRNRLIVWGGGHNDYYGNELYAVNLNDSSIQRLNDPGLPLQSTTTGFGQPAIANGTQANSRHTYDGIAYMANLDKMFVQGGAPAGAAGGITNDTWTFDFTTMQWQRMNPTGTIPKGVPGIVTAYDPDSGRVFVHDDTNLYAYDYTTNNYQRLAANNPIDYHLTSVIDPVRKRFIMIGSGQAWVYSIAPGSTYTRQALATTGGSAIINSPYPGLAYDSVSDRIVAWNGGDTAYSLNLDTNVWTASTFAGGPGAAQSNGTFRRWSYSPASQAFVLVNAMEQNAYTLRIGTPTADAIPDAFSFTSQSGIAPGAVVTSNTITPAGYNVAVSISVSAGASYSINGGAFVTTAGTISPGQTVAVRQTASNALGTTTSVTLNISGVVGTFAVSTQAASGTLVRIGETNVLATADSGNGNFLVAQSANLAQAATIQSLSFYVTAAAGTLRLGIYNAAGPGGGPGAKLAETAEITPIVGWNTATVVAPVLLPAGVYWLAYLPSSNGLAFRKAVDATSSGRLITYTYGVMPGTFPAAPTSSASHWSFYATLASGTVSAPAAPTNVSASAGIGSITVKFTAPAGNGGAAITGYTATCASSDGGALISNTGGAGATSIQVSGPTVGKRYTCTVTASNSVGSGPASTPSNAVTPFNISLILNFLLED